MDLSDLKGIISLMHRSDLTELEIEIQDLKLRLARPGSNQIPRQTIIHKDTVSPNPSVESNKAVISPKEKGLEVFTSPMVGTFYRKPSPDEPSFVQVGDLVKPGDVICIIEAMKVMNEIKSECSGEIIEISVEDGNSVEYGQGLFKIRNADG